MGFLRAELTAARRGGSHRRGCRGRRVRPSTGAGLLPRQPERQLLGIALVRSVIVILVADNISIRNDDQDYEGAV
jgi:hypothetical protein